MLTIHITSSVYLTGMHDITSFLLNVPLNANQPTNQPYSGVLYNVYEVVELII